MRYPTSSLLEQLEGSPETLEEASGKLEDDARALIPFTGYYGINTVPAAGAFFSIDTAEVYSGSAFSHAILTISVSLDGKTSTSHAFDGSKDSFKGTKLIIPDMGLEVDLNRGYQDGRLVQVAGTIGSTFISGFTYFNPVELPVFAGTYLDEGGKPRLIVSKSSVTFDDGSGPKTIPKFLYVPAMYVVLFDKYTLMLGTAGEQGLACFITDGAKSGYVVTIPKRKP